MDDVLAEVAAACRREGLIAPDAGVLVAVSGGPDSTALALLLAALRDQGLLARLEVAHLDHGWLSREAARAHQACVAALAARLGAPLHLARAEGEEARGEERARRWRYRQLEAFATGRGLRVVATGHHLGDQAETLLMRLLRGSGAVGLAGIPARRALGPRGVRVVRPLLGIEPERLRALLLECGAEFVEDPANRDLRYERVRARARLALHPEPGRARHCLAEAARRLAGALAREERRLEAIAEGSVRHLPWARAVSLERGRLAAEEGARLLLLLRLMGRRLWAERDGPWLTRRHGSRIAGLLAAGGALDLPRDLAFHVRGSRAWLYRRTEPPPRATLRAFPQPLDPGGRGPAAFAGPEGLRALLDARAVGPEPRLRALQAEDRFTPFGRGPSGRPRIAAWLQAQGYPGFVRRHVRVVEGRQGVAWVVGVRIDQAHAVGPATRAALGLEVHLEEP